jgi:hypothetical protein
MEILQKTFIKSRTCFVSDNRETSDLCKTNDKKYLVMTDREWTAFMQEWFERLIMRFDRIDRHLEKMAMKEKLLEGERLLDNQDVCQLLNVSKRTLQRYRSSGELPYQMICHKTFYKEINVEAFIKTNFAKGEDTDDENPDDMPAEETDNNNPDDIGNNPEETDNE